ncbi:uncharacterized protein LOC130894690 isoform X1 [Diorhabda carinulata]|uniref:uncharacterized protein LOC130894690 isoform X1 n=1 Tax=Diorhabda carinulata TaxID=1163345 RepID=UPI0025A13E81|nr:uncharacterized protein LOC130894690 isoform X1 [Diorhabda carinulata]
MESLEYYKSLITENEVINALIKESKMREGEIEKSRIRPNLQFFQRTVSNLVSSNNRIAVNQEKIRAKEKVKDNICRRRKVVKRKKMHIDYIKEILNNPIEFVKTSKDKCTSFRSRDEKIVIASPSREQNKTIFGKKSRKQLPQKDSNRSTSYSPKPHKKYDSYSSSSSNSMCSSKFEKQSNSTSSCSGNNETKSFSKSKKQFNRLDNSVITLSSTSSGSSTDSELDNCIIIEDSS